MHTRYIPNTNFDFITMRTIDPPGDETGIFRKFIPLMYSAHDGSKLLFLRCDYIYMA